MSVSDEVGMRPGWWRLLQVNLPDVEAAYRLVPKKTAAQQFGYIQVREYGEPRDLNESLLKDNNIVFEDILVR